MAKETKAFVEGRRAGLRSSYRRESIANPYDPSVACAAYDEFRAGFARGCELAAGR